jgi:hypothetical protein
MSERRVASRETPGTERAVPAIATVGLAIATVGPAIATVVPPTSAALSSVFGESRTKIAARTIVGPTTSTTSGTCVAAAIAAR